MKIARGRKRHSAFDLQLAAIAGPDFDAAAGMVPAADPIRRLRRRHRGDRRQRRAGPRTGASALGRKNRAAPGIACACADVVPIPSSPAPTRDSISCGICAFVPSGDGYGIADITKEAVLTSSDVRSQIKMHTAPTLRRIGEHELDLLTLRSESERIATSPRSDAMGQQPTTQKARQGRAAA
jgi:hypothetical protein